MGDDEFGGGLENDVPETIDTTPEVDDAPVEITDGLDAGGGDDDIGNLMEGGSLDNNEIPPNPEGGTEKELGEVQHLMEADPENIEPVKADEIKDDEVPPSPEGGTEKELEEVKNLMEADPENVEPVKTDEIKEDEIPPNPEGGTEKELEEVKNLMEADPENVEPVKADEIKDDEVPPNPEGGTEKELEEVQNLMEADPENVEPVKTDEIKDDEIPPNPEGGTEKELEEVKNLMESDPENVEPVKADEIKDDEVPPNPEGNGEGTDILVEDNNDGQGDIVEDGDNPEKQATDASNDNLPKVEQEVVENESNNENVSNSDINDAIIVNNDKGTEEINGNTSKPEEGISEQSGENTKLEDTENPGDGKSEVNEDVGEAETDIPPAFKQTEFSSSYESRISQTPAETNEKVNFEGTRGESRCALKSPPDPELRQIFDEAGIDGIQYKNGVPDFSPVAKAQFEIDHMQGGVGSNGNRARVNNFAQADQKFADQLNISPELARQFGMEPGEIAADDIDDLRKNNKLTWHELNDGKTIQLVPSVINKTFGHLGGVGEINAGAFAPGGFAYNRKEIKDEN